MRIDVLTLFPEMFASLDASIPGRARKAGVLELKCHSLRDFAINKYGQVDDVPFGGEAGMVLRPEPLKKGLEHVSTLLGRKPHVLHMSAQGRIFTQDRAKELAKTENLLIICGHYKGVDQRFVDAYVDEELSIGDYVVSGGELPAMVVIDAIARLLPGVLGDVASAETDSFFLPHRLGWPVYTRPQDFEGRLVPEALVSGHHENIRKWRIKASLELTRRNRPDLFRSAQLTDEEKKILGTSPA
ncbi:MAG: tRNA (guanosine(37)-N1)-methyltransferase TrmD [Fibrobacteres bacterium]|jgi:tRNA (guanine37-N1)-methyltransferase|nr:tRNA (guanosine(37)-N1)-methyltransferase TrmD [Fibrobacterota bacterium]